MKKKRARLWVACAVIAGMAVLIGLATEGGRSWTLAVYNRLRGRYTIQDRLSQYGDAARGRLRPRFEAAGVSYPPGRVVLAAFKAERRLELYGGLGDGNLEYVGAWEIRGASGKPGPKLREGDRQVPEGIYGIESLNPNSRFHLALRIGYPNEFDRRKAYGDGRENVGGDIMIHGGAASIGCLAMGDDVAEELFVLAADVGIDDVSVLLSPVDFRVARKAPRTADSPAWIDELYGALRRAVGKLPAKRSG